MKTNHVLTLAEYLDACRSVTKYVSAPAADARRIPITAEGDPNSGTEMRGCRCDRWGHRCPGCVEHKSQPRAAAEDFSATKEDGVN